LITDAHASNTPGAVQAVDFQQGFALERLAPLLEPASAPAAPPDLVQARSDIEAAAIWLEATTGNPKTRRAMRKEVERFILWGLHARGKELSQMGVMDIRAYVKFMADPQPARFGCRPSSGRGSIRTSDLLPGL
jgi:hypothetical protein